MRHPGQELWRMEGQLAFGGGKGWKGRKIMCVYNIMRACGTNSEYDSFA